MGTSGEGGGGSRAGYHHGDLRRRLVEVGEGLLEERGVEGFTLRECARRAGVSPSAPAHHFGNVAGLLTAIATVGYEGLAEAQESALVGCDGSPGGRLRAIGRAYIRYAIAHPARFRVAFGQVPLDKSDPALLEAGGRALGVLVREIRALRGGSPGEADGPEVAARVALAWSTVHGLAQLWIDDRLHVVAPGLAREALLDGLVEEALKLMTVSLSKG